MAAERARVQVQITTGKDKGKTGEVIEVKRAQPQTFLTYCKPSLASSSMRPVDDEMSVLLVAEVSRLIRDRPSPI